MISARHRFLFFPVVAAVPPPGRRGCGASIDQAGAARLAVVHLPNPAAQRTANPPSRRLAAVLSLIAGSAASRLGRASNPGYVLRHGSKNNRLGTRVSAGEVGARCRANGDHHIP
jgi:hypothetical protein